MRSTGQYLASYFAALALFIAGGIVYGAPPTQILEKCGECHNQIDSAGGLDLTSLSFDLDQRATRQRWIQIHDRIEKGEMPPPPKSLAPDLRLSILNSLADSLYRADLADIRANGRGPMRRLNREEFEQNLRDILCLPHLDIRDMLPSDRVGQLFNKTSESLDMSRILLTAYLDATESALRQAISPSDRPPETVSEKYVGTDLFNRAQTTGTRRSMFFARDSKAIELSRETYDRMKSKDESHLDVELCLFRSPAWPYSGFPQKLVAKYTGEYRVRFTARTVLQQEDYSIVPATRYVPMTFRSRLPSNHDIAEDIRATGGIIDVQPGIHTYETTVYLRRGQTLEYGLLGMPAPQVDAEGITGSYRFPPMPPEGHLGIAFQSLEFEGPLSPTAWPPPPHRILFDDLSAEVQSKSIPHHARRLLRRFVEIAARRPMEDDELELFHRLVQDRLARNGSLAESLISGYTAFLCADSFLYLNEPLKDGDHWAIANRLSHFLTNSGPDEELSELARRGKLRDTEILRRQTDRLIASRGFHRFVENFTNYWLNLRDLRRDDPDIRLYPEYRLDEYLVESMEEETRTFVASMVRENMPVTSVVTTDFAFVNDRLSRHYGLEPVQGSGLRKVELPDTSPYGGLLTQAAVLKVTANGSTTSPVTRGAWVMERLLGQPPPPPPPGVPAVDPDVRGAKTIRELLARHSTSPECGACHAKFDPVGFGLENFDVLGAWRTHYRGLEAGQLGSRLVTGIDRTGHDFRYTITATVDSSGALADGRRFEDIHQLKNHLAADPRQLARNLLYQLTTYSTGTPVRFADRREIEQILNVCSEQGYRIGDLVHTFIQSKIFLGQPGCQNTDRETGAPRT